MTHQFDICNGDADGLCAVRQWRLHAPASATLITGLKRDIELLKRVSASASAGDEVNVFDLSMKRNHSALLALLDQGVRVRYFDHHVAGDMPCHRLLEAHVDQAGDVCTSLLVDRCIGGAGRAWAMVGAYGDNLVSVADRLATESGLDVAARKALRRLGELINYNAYGDDEQDVYMAPAHVYAILARYQSPFDLLAHERFVDEIDEMRQSDLLQASALVPYWQNPNGRIFMLPHTPWARRAMGCLANELANAQPQQAHAVLTAGNKGAYVVSVRAPLNRASGADALCGQFGGNGRARSGGIDQLPACNLDQFVLAFGAMRWGDLKSASSDLTS